MGIDAASYQKNKETIYTVLLPFVAFMYLGIVLKKYSLEGYSDLVTNDYLLLGFKDLDALRKHLAENIIGSMIWGLSFMYIRKMSNPEARANAWKNRQDVYFATITTFITGIIKAATSNFAAKI